MKSYDVLNYQFRYTRYVAFSLVVRVHLVSTRLIVRYQAMRFPAITPSIEIRVPGTAVYRFDLFLNRIVFQLDYRSTTTRFLVRQPSTSRLITTRLSFDNHSLSRSTTTRLPFEKDSIVVRKRLGRRSKTTRLWFENHSTRLFLDNHPILVP